MKADLNNIDFREYNLDTIGVDSDEVKQLKAGTPKGSSISTTPTTQNQNLLQTCQLYWSALADFRDRRQRSRLYYRGDQWDELMDDPDNPGSTITEEEYITNQGKVALKQNIIRQVVKNMIGQYLNNPSKTTVLSHDRRKAKDAEILTNTIRSVHVLNRTDTLDTRNMEEFLLSGSCFQKVGYRYVKEKNRPDVVIQNCNPNRMFFNSDIYDPRGWDLRLIGELYDLDVDEVIAAFAKTEADAKAVRQIYAYSNIPPTPAANALSSETMDATDFFVAFDPNKCRVIEVWYLKAEWRTYAHDYLDGSYNIVPYSTKDIDAINQKRIAQAAVNGIPPDKVPLIQAERKYESFWYAKFMSPWGHTLWEGETPFMHEEHPFCFTLYPLLDGEVWGFVEDIIDQQRYINRIITLMDFIIGFSAKGVLLVPEDSIPDGMTLDDFATEWTKFNGVIKIKLKPGAQLPQQITGRAMNNGLSEMLMLQLKLLQDISGVNPSIQGQRAPSGTAASLYAQESINATMNSKDYMKTFDDFKKMRDTKVLQVVRQFYKEQRYIHVSGAMFDDAEQMYDPDRVRDIEVELAVVEGLDTPVYRQVTEQTLMQLLQMQAINVEMFLENSSLPYADRLLEQFRKLREQQAQAQQMNPAMMGQLAQQAQGEVGQGVDPQSMAMINQLMGQQQG